MDCVSKYDKEESRNKDLLRSQGSVKASERIRSHTVINVIEFGCT